MWVTEIRNNPSPGRGDISGNKLDKFITASRWLVLCKINFTEGVVPKLDDPTHHRDLFLLGQIARQEQAAFSELFDQRAPAILGVLSRVLDKAQAEVVLLEVFAEVWKEASRFHPNGTSPFSWMLQLARKGAVEHLRVGGRAHPVLSTEAPALPKLRSVLLGGVKNGGN